MPFAKLERVGIIATAAAHPVARRNSDDERNHGP
jgi:hypothetical protein